MTASSIIHTPYDRSIGYSGHDAEEGVETHLGLEPNELVQCIKWEGSSCEGTVDYGVSFDAETPAECLPAWWARSPR